LYSLVTHRLSDLSPVGPRPERHQLRPG
jgi:hypothetical protein